jgi:non-ribosomal peptide synthetase component F
MVDLTMTSPDVLDEFRATAGAHPDRLAIVADGREVSYRQAQELVARRARQLGHRPGTLAVPATHSSETIVSMLGLWAAGGTYCPVDPEFPARRRAAMRAAAGCGRVLDPAPAYLLFTSGSTGEPKPVVTSRRAVSQVVGSLRDLFEMTPDDRVLQFASLNWDTCFEEILPALTSGAALVLHRDAYSGSFPRLLRVVEQERVTVLNLPTAFWHELVNYLADSGAGLPERVRLVVIGGEPVAPACLQTWGRLRIDRARLLNTYGCTETTLITHAVDLTGSARAAADLAPAGTVLSRTVLSRTVAIGTALPHVVERIGDDGELLIGGPSLADGYLCLPQATAERFVTVDGVRMFRTGDRVERSPDGTLTHLGRLDLELKIRGIRVDPAEVEAQIAGCPGVAAVAVGGIRVAHHTALVAQVVARASASGATSGGAADPALSNPEDLPAQIVAHLRDQVPPHLIPSRITVVPVLARTASGKLDRHRIKGSHP